MQTIAISIKSVGVSRSYPALFSWAPVKPYDKSDNFTVAISNVIIHVIADLFSPCCQYRIANIDLFYCLFV